MVSTWEKVLSLIAGQNRRKTATWAPLPPCQYGRSKTSDGRRYRAQGRWRPRLETMLKVGGHRLAKLRPCRPVSQLLRSAACPRTGRVDTRGRWGRSCRLRDRWRPGVARTSLHTARTGAHVSGQSQVEGTSQCPVAAGALSGVDLGCQPKTKLTPARGAWLGAGGAADRPLGSDHPRTPGPDS